MLSPFDISNNILKKQPKLSDDVIESDLNVFMLNKIFSNSQSIATLSNELNKSGFNKKMIYDCYYYGVPKSSSYIKYNSKKEKADK